MKASGVGARKGKEACSCFSGQTSKHKKDKKR